MVIQLSKMETKELDGNYLNYSINVALSNIPVYRSVFATIILNILLGYVWIEGFKGIRRGGIQRDK